MIFNLLVNSQNLYNIEEKNLISILYYKFFTRMIFFYLTFVNRLDKLNIKLKNLAWLIQRRVNNMMKK